ncbi:calphotin-like [Malaya genurostris]|uniref:calphotin-like n=1 Tax=Malaya genurostris TaxID=325434 RepID=UPI0026F3FBA5|nr:calphotin-like [Malaya genurostris]
MFSRLLLLFICSRISSAGYVTVQLPYANPAGINYVSGQTHYQAGLLAGPVRYQTPVASPIAHPAPAFQVIRSPSYYAYNLPSSVPIPYPFGAYGQSGVSPVVYNAVHRPSVIAVTPQNVRPVVTQYHVPAVQPVHYPTVTAVPAHVPVAAVTPVTPIAPVAPVTPVIKTFTKSATDEESSYSGSTESPIHVIKSRKYKVRRPAIQNQFYDIEERVIIRPVGSALVELEHPISKTETSVKTKTIETTHHESGGGGGGGGEDYGYGHAVSTEATVTQRPHIIQTNTVYHQQIPQQQVPALVPHPVVVHGSNTGHVGHPFVVPAAQTPVYVNVGPPVFTPVHSIPATGIITTLRPPSHVTYPVQVVTTPAPTAESTTVSDGGLDYDDSIVVEARGGARTPHETSSTESSQHYSTTPAKYRKSENNDVEDLPKRGDIAITYATEATHQSISREEEINTTETATTAEPQVAVQASFKNLDINARFATQDSNKSQAIIVTNHSRSQSRPSSAEFSEVSTSSPRVVISNGIPADQARSNQELFIRLLSERDSIAEVGYGPNTDTSSSLINTYVRSRVLSATPAPYNAKESSETVNIRRIIVSRPIETEQEVEVREHSISPSHAKGYQIEASKTPVYRNPKQPIYVPAPAAPSTETATSFETPQSATYPVQVQVTTPASFTDDQTTQSQDSSDYDDTVIIGARSGARTLKENLSTERSQAHSSASIRQRNCEDNDSSQQTTTTNDDEN